MTLALYVEEVSDMGLIISAHIVIKWRGMRLGIVDIRLEDRKKIADEINRLMKIVKQSEVNPGLQIKQQIFAGGTTFYHTLGLMHDLINRSLTLISGLQQPPHSPDEETARMNKIEEDIEWGEVESYVSDIVCGLLGTEYKVVKVAE